MVSKVAVFQHSPTEGLGSIGTWLERKGAVLCPVEWWKENPYPEVDDFDGCVVLGGAMNIYQHRDFPWLIEEKARLTELLSRRIPILGVCLGAQLLADCLGAKVVQNSFQEIGWWPLVFSDEACEIFPQIPRETLVFHWHGDTFSLPAGALRLASSPACREQGFFYRGSVLGLQFHPEVTEEMLADFCGEEEAKPIGEWVQKNEVILQKAPEECPKLEALLDALLTPLFTPEKQ